MTITCVACDRVSSLLKMRRHLVDSRKAFWWIQNLKRKPPTLHLNLWKKTLIFRSSKPEIQSKRGWKFQKFKRQWNLVANQAWKAKVWSVSYQGWLTYNFSSQYHPWIIHVGHGNKGNDHLLKKLLTVKTNSPC